MSTTTEIPEPNTAPAPSRPGLARLRERFSPWTPHVLLGAVFCVVWTILSVARYERFGAEEWDLGIFTQAVRGYAHLGAPISDIKGPGFNVLGDHFSPIIATIAPSTGCSRRRSPCWWPRRCCSRSPSPWSPRPPNWR
ncbi:hypothetical protein GXW82_41395 [Streptacidiphilus sp. 4-A2]|nr:hypothetical protein [Streptacidiphilus sp. 4-A2]